MKGKIWTTLITTMLLGVQTVRAHCPLCTIGAAAVAGGAAVIGVNSAAIGVFIGAFAMSTGWWFARIIKKKFIPYQDILIIFFSFVSTIYPMTAFLSDTRPFYLSWIGRYGTTLAIDIFLFGSLIGGAIIVMTPWLSRQITLWRNGKMISYQGVLLTLGLVIFIGTIMQFTI